MSDRDIVERLREDAAVTASSASAWLEREAAEEIERLRAEHDRYRAALQTIAADRCRFCGAITETPCRHEGMWLKCERRGSATYWDDVAAKQVAQEALKELKEPAPCS